MAANISVSEGEFLAKIGLNYTELWFTVSYVFDEAGIRKGFGKKWLLDTTPQSAIQNVSTLEQCDMCDRRAV